MQENILEKRKFSLALCAEWLKESRLTEEEKEAVLEYAKTHTGKVEELHQIYRGICEGKECSTETLEIQLTRQDGTLKMNGIQVQKPLSEMKRMLEELILILEDILPLGSMVSVDLSHSGMESELPLEEVKVIVVERFMKKEEESLFVPYGGIIYPFGNTKKQLLFTERAVKKLIKRGYEDKQEIAFVAGIKRQMLRTGCRSYTFVNTGERSHDEITM